VTGPVDAQVTADFGQLDATERTGVTRAVVIYESLTGNTARAARLVADEVAEQGVDVSVYPITDIGLKDLAEADIVFIGTWVDGLVLFGHRPGRAGRIRSMPVIDGKRVAAFMTYAIHAGKALDRFARVLEERGATVVSRTLLRRDRLEAGIAEFVTASLDSVPA
jgi:Flavodoxin domain